MMHIDFIKTQMETAEINANQLAKLSEVGYATISDIINGRSKLENIPVRNYNKIVNSLFTQYEQYIWKVSLSQSMSSSNYTRTEWYCILINKKLKFFLEHQSEDLKIELSGILQTNAEDSHFLSQHVNIVFNDIDGKHAIRIFNTELYNSLNYIDSKNKTEVLKNFIIKN